MENTTPIVSYCGLYCTNCPKFVKGNCPGCHQNNKATWCKVRTCCMDHNRATCADCTDFGNLKECKKLNNFVAKMFGLVFNSDRVASLTFIKAQGTDAFISKMESEKAMTFKRKR